MVLDSFAPESSSIWGRLLPVHQQHSRDVIMADIELAGEGYAVTAVDLSDAVMSNVALHMFPDDVTRAVFAQVRRLVHAGGLFVFHVNSLQDRPLRARNLPARELEPDYVAEESGQTVDLFSEAYLRQLLAGWQQVQLGPGPGSASQDG